MPPAPTFAVRVVCGETGGLSSARSRQKLRSHKAVIGLFLLHCLLHKSKAQLPPHFEVALIFQRRVRRNALID